MANVANALKKDLAKLKKKDRCMTRREFWDMAYLVALRDDDAMMHDSITFADDALQLRDERWSDDDAES